MIQNSKFAGSLHTVGVQGLVRAVPKSVGHPCIFHNCVFFSWTTCSHECVCLLMNSVPTPETYHFSHAMRSEACETHPFTMTCVGCVSFLHPARVLEPQSDVLCGCPIRKRTCVCGLQGCGDMGRWEVVHHREPRTTFTNASNNQKNFTQQQCSMESCLAVLDTSVRDRLHFAREGSDSRTGSFCPVHRESHG